MKLLRANKNKPTFCPSKVGPGSRTSVGNSRRSLGAAAGVVLAASGGSPNVYLYIYNYIYRYIISGWWLQIFFYFHPYLGK